MFACVSALKLTAFDSLVSDLKGQLKVAELVIQDDEAWANAYKAAMKHFRDRETVSSQESLTDLASNVVPFTESSPVCTDLINA